MNSKRTEYEERLYIQLKQWDAQIDLLKAKADAARAEAKADYYKTIYALQSKKAEAGVRLSELRAAGDEAWEDIKLGTEKAWNEVKSAFHSASSKFK